MASLVYEVAQEYPPIEIEVIPGITAACGGAAVLHKGRRSKLPLRLGQRSGGIGGQGPAVVLTELHLPAAGRI